MPQVLYAANDVLPVTLEFAGVDGLRLASLRLVSADGRIWAQQDVLVEQDGMLRVGLMAPAGMPAGRYALRLSLAHPDDGRPISLLAPAGQGSELALGEIDVQAPTPAPPLSALPMEHSQEASLGDAARLLGYSATPGPLLPGNDLTVNLFWQALPGAADADLSAFVQLLDRQGQVAAAWEGTAGALAPDHGLAAGRAAAQPAHPAPAGNTGRRPLQPGSRAVRSGHAVSGCPPPGKPAPSASSRAAPSRPSWARSALNARKLTTAAPEPRVDHRRQPGAAGQAGGL